MTDARSTAAAHRLGVLRLRSQAATALAAMPSPQMPTFTIIGFLFLIMLVWGHYDGLAYDRQAAECKRDLELLPTWRERWPILIFPLAIIWWSFGPPPANQAEVMHLTWVCIRAPHPPPPPPARQRACAAGDESAQPQMQLLPSHHVSII